MTYANDPTIYSLEGAATTFLVVLAVVGLGLLVASGSRRRARDRRRAAYAAAWRAEYLVGYPFDQVPTSGPQKAVEA